MDFILRKWLESDAHAVYKYANNKKIADNLRDGFPYPYKLSDAVSFTKSMAGNDDKSQCCRAIVINNEAIGSIGLFIKDDVYRKSAEIGYWLAEPFWNQGIVSSAVKQLCKYGFDNYDIIRIYAEPFAHNIGSCKVLEKAGFTLEGILKKSVCKNNDIFDSCMYAILNN